MTWRWLLLNACALALYLGLEVWALHSRIGSESYDPIDVFIFWCKHLLPVLIAAWAANVVWAVRIARGPEETRNRDFAWWLGVFLVWCAALAYKGAGILLRIL